MYDECDHMNAVQAIQQQPVGACEGEFVWPDDHHFVNNYTNKYLDMFS